MNAESRALLDEVRLAHAAQLALRFIEVLVPYELGSFEDHVRAWFEEESRDRTWETREESTERAWLTLRYRRVRSRGFQNTRDLAAAYEANPAVRGKLYQFVVAGMFLDFLKTAPAGDFPLLKERFSEKLPLFVDAYYRPTSRVTREDLGLLQEELARITLDFYRISGHIRAGDVRIESPSESHDELDFIWGTGPEAADKLDQVKRLACSEVPVLITGETGAGKTYLAQRIHEMSRRTAHRFLAINCAAIPSSLFQSEFFGYRKGAFTGAAHDKTGLLKSADRGTVFLDEIGELAMEDQVKLLAVLETKTVIPLGGLKEVPLDLRFLAGTNRLLEADVDQGRFRKDLYYRIKGAHVRVPPLRERTDSLSGLVHKALSKIGREEGIRPVNVSSAVLERFRRYAWPGNIRELENVLHRAVALARPGDIELRHLPPELLEAEEWTDPGKAAEEYVHRLEIAREGVADLDLQDFLMESAGRSFDTRELAAKLGTLRRKGGLNLESLKRHARRRLAPLKGRILDENGLRGQAVRYRLRPEYLDLTRRKIMHVIDQAVSDAGLPRSLSFDLFDEVQGKQGAPLTHGDLKRRIHLSPRKLTPLIRLLEQRGILIPDSGAERPSE